MIKLLKSDPYLGDHIVIRRSSRARRLALKLDPQARVFHLVIPPRVSMKRAYAFAEENESWMQEQLAELGTPIYFEHGTTIPIFGQDVTIKINHDDSIKRTLITLEDGTLFVNTNLDDAGPRIKRYLKKLVKDEITILAHEKAKKIGKKINAIYVRDTKTRWGSCSEDGNLNFSWRLIFAPYEALDYVVGHEVAHLKHLDHSKAFWSVCRKLSNDFVEGKYWMQANGSELMRYC